MTAVDSPRGGLRDWAQTVFVPRTAAPTTATILRSVLWPVAILAVIHRSIVLPANGNITDDFKPVYRALSNFRHGWDIYNEHFDYVDPHYLYPPGGTLIMAPFGYLPFAESRYLFVAVNSAAIVLAGYVLLMGVQSDPIVGSEGVSASAATIINATAASKRVMWQGIGHGASVYSSCAVPPLVGYLDSGNLPATDTYCPA